MELRWNLIIFGGVLLVLLATVMYFALSIINTEVVLGNEELVLGSVIAIVTTAVGFVGGYCTGVMQALTSPSSPAPTVTEDTLIKIISGKCNCA